jgi:hypothetical protein
MREIFPGKSTIYNVNRFCASLHRQSEIRAKIVGWETRDVRAFATTATTCASLVLHLHQIGQGTPPKLSNMFGTQHKGPTLPAGPCSKPSREREGGLRSFTHNPALP